MCCNFATALIWKCSTAGGKGDALDRPGPIRASMNLQLFQPRRGVETKKCRFPLCRRRA